MNKSLHFILIPFLALLFSWNDRGDVSAAIGKPATGFSYLNKTDQNDLLYPLKIKKEQSEKIKNKIRIKAWDDAAAVSISGPEIPKAILIYNTQPIYGGYCFSFSSVPLSQRCLRGPPVA